MKLICSSNISNNIFQQYFDQGKEFLESRPYYIGYFVMWAIIIQVLSFACSRYAALYYKIKHNTYSKIKYKFFYKSNIDGGAKNDSTSLLLMTVMTSLAVIFGYYIFKNIGAN